MPTSPAQPLLLDGRRAAEAWKEEIHSQIQTHALRPGLAVLLVGEHPASLTYVHHKQRDALEVGIDCIIHRFSATASYQELFETIDALNRDPTVHGILVQLPLPAHIQTEALLEAVDPSKDVDGFHPYNVGQLALGGDGFVPCTPLGVDRLCHHYKLSLGGMEVVILGRSRVVGKPLMLLWSQKRTGGSPTVTLAHSESRDLPSICRRADLLVVATGHHHLVTPAFVKPGAIVVDVGMHIHESSTGKSKLSGDVCFEEVAPLCRAITPVPGGVGPMTRASLLFNTLKSAKRFQDSSHL